MDVVEALEFISLQPSDAQAVFHLYSQYRVTPYPIEKLAIVLGGAPNLGVWHQAELIGFVYCEPFAPDIIEVSSLYVAAQYRNLGIGHALLKKMHAHLALVGFKSAILYNSQLYETIEPKRSAGSFYTRAGYSQVISTGDTDLFVINLDAPEADT